MIGAIAIKQSLKWYKEPDNNRVKSRVIKVGWGMPEIGDIGFFLGELLGNLALGLGDYII